MTMLDKRLRDARARIIAVRLADTTATALFAAFCILTVAAALDKSGLVVLADWRKTALPTVHLNMLLGVAAASLLVGWIWARKGDYGARRVALAADSALGLDERVTSALAVSRSGLPMGELVAADAERNLEGADMRKAFPLRVGRPGRWFPLAALAWAAALFVMPEMDALGARTKARQERARIERDAKEAHDIREEIRRNREDFLKLIEKNAGKNKAKKLEQQLEAIEKEKIETPGIEDKKKWQMVKNRMNELIDQEMQELNAQRSDSGEPEVDRRRRSLRRLGEKMDREKDGFGEAGEAMRKWRRRLMKNEKLDKEELKRLRKDVEAMADQLRDNEQFRQLSKQLDDFADDLADMENMIDPEKMQKLQDILKDALKGEKKNLDWSKLTDEEKQLMRDLQKQFAKMMNQMQMTEEMLDKLQQAADAGRIRQITPEMIKKMLEQMKNMDPNMMGKGQEGDEGCSNGQAGGGLPQWLMMSLGQGNGGMPGSGMPGQGTGGLGRGGGTPPESASEVELEKQRLRGRVGEGEIIGQWFVRQDPTDEPGTPEIEYRTVMREATLEAAGALDEEIMPRTRKRLIREYMDRLTGEAPPEE